ncbi:MAG: dTDP-4-dehydrorhamnose reductase [Clostridia bacterium]|nr:dTDP-4-dehydrorhamnose reductase [Clostridia bacterium]
MKVIVTGAKGQLGTDVTALLKERGIDVFPLDIPEYDITDSESVKKAFDEFSPDAVIHLAAFTAVDKAESDRETCRRVNVTGTENIARLCSERNIKILYTSTDYVFGGEGEEFYETDSPKAPLNYYGETKLLGEQAVERMCEKHFIVRISWVFGPCGKNFVYTMMRLGAEKDEIRVVDDQVGSPTYTRDLAPLMCDMIQSEKYGVYHATNEGVCSFAEFADEIMKAASLKAKIIPITSDEYPSAAKRPHNSRLSKKSLDEAGFSRLPGWQDAVERFVALTKEETAI